jgi:site-specific DNA recombinase
VQQRLAQARTDRRSGTNANHPSLLAGMLSDPVGESMSATHATKAGRRYRYYVSSQLITGTRDEHADGL